MFFFTGKNLFCGLFVDLDKKDDSILYKTASNNCHLTKNNDEESTASLTNVGERLSHSSFGSLCGDRSAGRSDNKIDDNIRVNSTIL